MNLTNVNTQSVDMGRLSCVFSMVRDRTNIQFAILKTNTTDRALITKAIPSSKAFHLSSCFPGVSSNQ